MIAGETDMILHTDYDGSDYETTLNQDEDYDEFLFRSKAERQRRKALRQQKRAARRSKPKRVARRKKRRSFFGKLGNAYKEIGGATVLGSAIDAMTKKPEGTPVAMPPEEDFNVSMTTDNSKEKGIPKIYLIAGGVLVAGVLGLTVMQMRKNR